MAIEAEVLRTELLALSEAARAELVLDLLDSLDGQDTRINQADLDRTWAAEIADRADQLDGGQVAMHSWDEVLEQVERARSAP